MVDVLAVAVQTANLRSTPDTFKTNGTVKVLALLEEESTVGHSAHPNGPSRVLAWVLHALSKEIKHEEHQRHVDCDDENEHMKNDPEHVNNVCLKSTFNLHLLIRQFVIWVEAIVDEGKEKDEGVEDADNYNKCCTILVISPVLDSVAAIAAAYTHHVFEPSEDSGWEVGESVNGCEPNHHNQ